MLDWVKQATGADVVCHGETIQSLWSGYGEIIRLYLNHEKTESVILKHVKPPSEVNHPRGWHSDISHNRKLKSYDVEMHWYQHYSQQCNAHCCVPQCIGTKKLDDEYIILMQDLDAVGFAIRKEYVNKQDIHACLHWLANFHATFLHVQPIGLWETGSYWHLQTRPDELAVMQNKRLQQAAVALDDMLNHAKYQTLIHGDAKLANFCFSDKGEHVAAVDFQYVGGGCGIKDVAYFLGSCLHDTACETDIPALLDVYFEYLRTSIKHKNNNIHITALEHEWRELFPIAWTDFYRFLDGWLPNHWKINRYTRNTAEQVLSHIIR